ncbi:MAG: hypothetical protein ACOX5A_12330 [Aminivibrio sp.]
MGGEEKLVSCALPFPRWMKWAGLLIGLFLFSDGLRRLLTGGGAAEFMSRVFIGSACVYTAGYNKTIALSVAGFERQTRFWGRGRTEVIPWSDMEEVILLPAAGGTGAIFSTGARGRRAFFQGVSGDEIIAVVKKHSPGLKISGEERSHPLKNRREEN